jgi:hypothetical protein
MYDGGVQAKGREEKTSAVFEGLAVETRNVVLLKQIKDVAGKILLHGIQYINA